MHGDYYLPNLGINEEEPTYGKYGIMRKQFLKEHRSARYQYLVLTGKLTEHLNQVDKEAREKVEMLMKQMVEQWGVTEVADVFHKSHKNVCKYTKYFGFTEGVAALGP